MNVVVGAAVPVSSSLDSAAQVSNVVLCLSLHSSPSRNSSKNLSFSVCRYTSRKGRGIAEAKASSFSIDSDDEEEELTYGNTGAQGSQFAGRRNMTRRLSQGESAAKASVSGASHLWKTQKQHATEASLFDIHQARVSLSSEFAHASQNRDRADAMAHMKGSNSLPFEEKQQRAPFVGNPHRRVPLPTKNRHLRMHNKVSPFESVRHPSVSQLSLNNHADASSWGVVDEDVAPPNFNGPTPNFYQDFRRRPKNSQFSSHGIKENVQKGTQFMSKMEEVLLSLKKKDDRLRNNPAMNQKALRDESTFTHAGRGFRTATSKGKKAEESGVLKPLKSSENQTEKYGGSEIESSARYANITSARDGNRGSSLINDGKSLQNEPGQVTSSLKENARLDKEVGVTTFNLFSSSPSVPWEADRTYAASTFKPCIPVRRGNLRSLALRSFRSAGSRLSPSRPSVSSRNVNHLKLDAHAAISVVDQSKRIGGHEQTEARFEVREGNVLNDEKSTAQIASLKGAAKAEAQVESVNYEWIESIAEENGDKAFSKHQSTGKSLIEAHAPAYSSLSVSSLHDDLDSEVNEESNVLTESRVEDVVPPGIDSFARSHHNKKSSANSGDLDVDGASLLEFSSSEMSLHNMKEILPSSMIHTNVASAEYPGEMTLGASEVSNGSNHPNFASWHKHDFPDLPFEFQFSYSETPKAPVLGYRETPYSPFGPSTMGRPWTGGPHPVPSKKKKQVFDSFKPPPKDKKGVKHVEDPGPYPEGQGPKSAKSREEILGEPLTKEEIVYLVEKCERGSRQLNLGRDGLTHNMLDLIHCHWKRRRVCKITCKGVPTLDMENVKFHIEDKTGGKILYQAGGVLYLFRGLNYNYKDRPQIPLMKWKPMTPYYPKLIQPAPEGLTKEEAHRLRVLGRKVQPMCRLGKNGVYLNLVKDVRAAFKVDELVRIDCQGLHSRDYKKIGAKLKDLVPCVLLSFDKESILMWKGKQDLLVENRSLSRSPDLGPDHTTEEILKQSSSVTEEGSDRSICEEKVDIIADEASSSAHLSGGEPNNSEQESGNMLNDASQEFSTHSSDAGAPSVLQKAKEHAESEKVNTDETLSSSNTKDEGQALTGAGKNKCASNSQVLEEENFEMSVENINGSLKNIRLMGDGVYMPSIDSTFERHATADRKLQQKTESKGLATTLEEMSYPTNLKPKEDVDEESVQSEAASLKYIFMHEEGGLVGDKQVDMCLDNQSNDVVHLDALWDHAFQSGMAVKLPNKGMDADLIVWEAAQLAELAPLGPTYTMKLMYKLRLKKNQDRPDDILQIRFGRGRPKMMPKKVAKRKFQLPTLDVPGMGGLPVDELAMLLAPK